MPTYKLSSSPADIEKERYAVRARGTRGATPNATWQRLRVPCNWPTGSRGFSVTLHPSWFYTPLLSTCIYVYSRRSSFPTSFYLAVSFLPLLRHFRARYSPLYKHREQVDTYRLIDVITYRWRLKLFAEKAHCPIILLLHIAVFQHATFKKMSTRTNRTAIILAYLVIDRSDLKFKRDRRILLWRVHAWITAKYFTKIILILERQPLVC